MIITINWVKNVIVKINKQQSEYITFEKFKDVYNELNDKERSESAPKSDSDITKDNLNNSNKNNENGESKKSKEDNQEKETPDEKEIKEDKDSRKDKLDNNNLNRHKDEQEENTCVTGSKPIGKTPN